MSYRRAYALSSYALTYIALTPRSAETGNSGGTRSELNGSKHFCRGVGDGPKGTEGSGGEFSEFPCKTPELPELVNGFLFHVGQMSHGMK